MEDKRYITFEKWFPVNCEYLCEIATVTRVSPTARILFDTFSGICDKGNNLRTNYTELSAMLGLRISQHFKVWYWLSNFNQSSCY